MLLAGACAVRAPARVDVQALVAARGADEARRALVARVLADPRDVGAKLALAALAEQLARPAEAIEQLDAVIHVGGPLGTRWHPEDRARLARLLHARGRATLARGSAAALGDLERAAKLGAQVSSDELARAGAAIAIGQLRHVDAALRAQGRSTLAAAPAHLADPSWKGARPEPSPAERAELGVWLWNRGARRAAYDELEAWRAATPAPRDARLHAAYLRALAWWTPLWLGGRLPPASELVGDGRCWFPGTECEPPWSEAAPLSGSAAGQDGDAAPAWAVAPAHYAITRLRHAWPDAPIPDRWEPALIAIARAYRRDPQVAERLGRDLVASSIDAAAASAAVGAVFDVLGDPARARAAWQAALELDPDPAIARGLAEATARGKDAPAARVFAITAAAASGDPAVVWIAVGEALVEVDEYVQALTAARSALELAGPEALPRAFDLAITASRALGRTEQVAALTAQRARIPAPPPARDAAAVEALAAFGALPDAAAITRLRAASIASPRDVELRAALVRAMRRDDPRRAEVIAELIALAGDADTRTARAAVAALR
jgi:tetratricopeptide (TPR) repeat protein